jgi:hypothetical protein
VSNLIVDSPLEIRPFYYRHRVWAASWILPFEVVSFKGAANWMIPVGKDVRRPEEEGLIVAALEKNVEFDVGMVSFLIEYAQSLHHQRTEVSFLRSPFERSWIAGLRLPLYESHEVLSGLIYDSVGKSSIAQLGYKYRLTEEISLELQGRFLNGDGSTLIGLYREYDKYTARLTYAW